MNKLGLLTYAEEGAKRELERRMDLCAKHGFCAGFLENMEITLKNLKEIREMIEEERRR